MASPEILPTMQIDLFSHCVKVTRFNQIGKGALLEYCRGLAQWGPVRVGPGRFERRMLRVFVGVTATRDEFRFHINQFEDLCRHLARYGFYMDTNVRLIHHPIYAPVPCEFTMRDLREERDYQIPLVNYLVEPGSNKVVNLQTGRGKTFIALKALQRIAHRVVCVVKGMYIDKWVPDVESAYVLKKGDLMVIRGKEHLNRLIMLAQADVLEAKFILISLKTMFLFLKHYESHGATELGSLIHPEDFYPLIGAGVRLIDEVHQDFHCNFRQDLYTHVPKTISLSATLESDDPFINSMYALTWPMGIRAPHVEYDRYIVVKSLWYSLNKPQRVRWKNAMKQYSHVLFEQSIMKDKDMLTNYVEMINAIVMTSFIRTYEEGQKMLIFFATIEMCTYVVGYLKSLHPSLKVGRYVEEDKVEELHESDLIVSTLISAGTAVDVPNLRICLMTTALSSKQANIQALGRLRRLKDWPHIHPEFIFLSAREMEKHRQYAEQKREKTDGKVLSFRDFETQFRV